MIRFNREFTKGEKIVILVLVLILMGLGYYFFVDKPIRTEMQEAEYRKDELELEYQTVTNQVISLQKMQEELEELGTDGVSYMPSYNASNEEMAFLNGLLADTDEYNITFSDVTREGNQIRRPFVLQFDASSYSQAKKILEQLYSSQDRCLISDISISGNGNYYNMRSVPVKATVSAYFYETMADGTADDALPPDTSTAEELANETDETDDSDLTDY